LKNQLFHNIKPSSKISIKQLVFFETSAESLT